jgi:hypothetical protein
VRKAQKFALFSNPNLTPVGDGDKHGGSTLPASSLLGFLRSAFLPIFSTNECKNERKKNILKTEKMGITFLGRSEKQTAICGGKLVPVV